MCNFVILFFLYNLVHFLGNISYLLIFFTWYISFIFFFFSLNIIPDSELISNEDLGNTTGFLTGVGSVESAYLIQSTRCVSEHRDWDVPAILTAIQYLVQLEVSGGVSCGCVNSRTFSFCVEDERVGEECVE